MIPAELTYLDSAVMVRALRDRGYAVVIFDEKELRGADPRRIEDGLVDDGFERIGHLATDGEGNDDAAG